METKAFDLMDSIHELSMINAASGREQPVRDYIISAVSRFGTGCDLSVDARGSLIVFKKGEKTPKNKVILDAHMDEVGVIATYVCDDGLIKFSCVGGIDARVMLARQFVFESGAVGVAGVKPIHMLTSKERKTVPSVDDMYIDIGADSREEALKRVKPGDTAVFHSDFYQMGGHKIKGKALDNRVGCAILLDLILSPLEYDAYFSFSVQEEIGLRGAGACAFAVKPDRAVVLETTTAADIADVPENRQVCRLADGAVVSFMDKRTMYDREMFEKAFETARNSDIKIQTKNMIAGGNNAGAISTSGSGVRTIAVNVPCRYLHSPSCVCDVRDILCARDLTRLLIGVYAND